jgi:hypothetical protein
VQHLEGDALAVAMGRGIDSRHPADTQQRVQAPAAADQLPDSNVRTTSLLVRNGRKLLSVLHFGLGRCPMETCPCQSTEGDGKKHVLSRTSARSIGPAG